MHVKQYFMFTCFLLMGLIAYSQVPSDSDNLVTSKKIYSNIKDKFDSFIAPGPPGPEHVFIVYSINSTYGDSIASYYKNARNIPIQNICAISCDTSEVITRDYYNTNIRDVLRDSLIQRGIKEQIRFIVLTKGIPIKISGSDQSCLDSDLCLLFNDEYSIGSRIHNPYFGEIYYFDSFTYPIYSTSQISYLVSRLDAFTLNDVIQMIDRGVNPDTSGINWYILDDYPGLEYDKMYDAKRILDELGKNSVYDNTTSHITDNVQGDVIGYCGHGVHAGAGYPFVLNDLNFTFANGALFNTYESFNGWSFFLNGRQSNHNLISDFIAIGGTGGIGHVYEPYASAIPHENILFSRYANGFTLVEAAYMSMAYLSWQNVVVGDPLCRLKSSIPVFDYAPFTQITSGDIVNDGGTSKACAWADYDNDGYQDLFVANYDEINFLYRNNGNGSFTKVLDGSFGTDAGKSSDCSWTDYDNDGFYDLFVGNGSGKNFLYKNNGNGILFRIYSGDLVNESSRFSSWIDLNKDGFIDFFNFGQYYNNANGILTCLTGYSLPLPSATLMSGSLGDFDNDGDEDFFSANNINSGGNKNNIYINNGDSTFTSINLSPLTDDIARSYGAKWIDFDYDQDLDLFVTNEEQRNNFFYLNNNDGTFTSIIDGIISNDCGNSYGSAWIDYDNDGELDLFVTNYGFNNLLYRKNNDGSFTKLLATDIGLAKGCSWGDYDNDGDLDLFVANDGDNFLYRNDTFGNNWVKIKLIGMQSNKAAIGSIAEVKAQMNGIPKWQIFELRAEHGYATHNTLIPHFGLANANIIDSIKIKWPSGIITDTSNIAVNQIISITEPSAPLIAFIADRTYFQSIPAQIQFTDLSYGNNTSWKWYFGNGDSSLIQNPAYAFEDFGEFDITLITSDGIQSDTLTKRKYIIIDQFVKATNIGIISAENNSCCNWIDYNSDGLIDLYIGNMGGDKFLYKNSGNGIFQQITNCIIVTDRVDGYDSSWGDYDNDGDLDLFLTSYQDYNTNSLYENNGDETFSKITSGIIVNEMQYGSSCSWIDYDNDGLLDMFAANEGYNFLYKGIGNGDFAKVDTGDIVTLYHDSWAQGWSDYDKDGDMDVFIGNPYDSESYFYQNNGDGTFMRDQSIIMKHKAQSCTWGDYNNDGFFDLFLTDWPTNVLLKNNGDGTFIEINQLPTGDNFGRTASWVDFNNDGYLDLVVGDSWEENHETNLYQNNGDGTFFEIDYWQIINRTNSCNGISWADYDDDGDLDLFMVHPDILYNNVGNNNNWIKVKCTGVVSNRDAIGTRIKIVAQINGNNLKQYREITAKTAHGGQNDFVAHFGLGDATSIDSLIIKWPSGINWDTTNVSVNQLLKIKERLPDPPPLISELPIISFNEDDSLLYLKSNWYPFVSDSNNADSTLLFSVVQSNNVYCQDYDSAFCFNSKLNWNGLDTLQLLVSDRSTTVSADLIFNIYSINDPPLINSDLPDTLSFRSDSSFTLNIWEYVYDVDQADSLLNYKFPTKIHNDSLIRSFVDTTGLLTLSAFQNYSGNVLMYLEVEDDSGSTALDSITVIVENSLGMEDPFAGKIPDTYILFQNYPNPFNPITKIRYGVPKVSDIKITIYNIVGEQVDVIVNEKVDAGYHLVNYDANNLASGIYIYCIKTKEFQKSKKMILLR